MYARVRMGRPAVSSSLPLNIVLHGASIWGNTPDGGTDVAAKLRVLLPTATVAIVSIGEATFTGLGGSYSLKDNFAGDVDANWKDPALWQNRVYVGSGAELDEINDQSGTAASTKASCASYITTAKTFTHGGQTWRVYPFSCIATTEFPALQSIRDGYNTAIQSDFAGGSGYGNLISVPELQDASNTTYFFDGIHCTSAGRQKIADYMATL